MKVGFIGLGRMGQVMARRLIDGGHEVGVYNRTPEKLKPLTEHGAKALSSIKDAATFGAAVFTMLTDDAAVLDVVTKPGGLKDSLPKGGVHICAGTHSVAAIVKLTELHAAAGQVLIASPVLGRPEVVTAGSATMVVGGPKDNIAQCRPLIAAIAGRVIEAGTEPVSAAAIKIANNFVLGCAIEALGEGFALTRKYGVAPDVFYGVLADGLFNCWAYKTYGKFIAEERYLPPGQSARNGLKDANLALAAGEAKGVPLPSGNVWRDRLVGAVAHGEGDHDWAVMAKDQARASGLVK
jgi:3-hydroxyisobutyrate dehydrogenase-like beta-hydroxyacid dehydrogenase